MRGSNKKLILKVQEKRKNIEKNQEFVRIRRNVMLRVSRKVEREDVKDHKKKENFVKVVKGILAGLRLKDAFSAVRNRFSFKRFSFRESQTSGNLMENLVPDELNDTTVQEEEESSNQTDERVAVVEQEMEGSSGLIMEELLRTNDDGLFKKNQLLTSNFIKRLTKSSPLS